MFPLEFWSLEPREFAAWVKSRQKFTDIESRNKVELMRIIRWGFGFLANFWSKKAIKIEPHYPLLYDDEVKREVIKEDDFEALKKKFDDSANNR